MVPQCLLAATAFEHCIYRISFRQAFSGKLLPIQLIKPPLELRIRAPHLVNHLLRPVKVSPLEIDGQILRLRRDSHFHCPTTFRNNRFAASNPSLTCVSCSLIFLPSGSIVGTSMVIAIDLPAVSSVTPSETLDPQCSRQFASSDA